MYVRGLSAFICGNAKGICVPDHGVGVTTRGVPQQEPTERSLDGTW